MKIQKLLNKPLCISLLGCAFIYGLILPFCWGNDPTLPTGTISLLCEDRKIFFWIWGLLGAGSIILNIQYMYRKFNSKNKFLNTLCILALMSILGVALTLDHSTDSWNPKRIAHWVATGCFVVFIIAAIALFFLININKYKRFGILTACSFGILATFLFMFLVIGKSGLMEMIPLAMMEIFLFVVNFTPVGKVIPKK